MHANDMHRKAPINKPIIILIIKFAKQSTGLSQSIEIDQTTKSK